MPYFKARLSERWEERANVLYVRLPEGCTVSALTMLFERLHFPAGRWGDVPLSAALQMVQLSGMFLAEGDGLCEELTRLVRASVRCQADIDAVTAFVQRVDAPACVVELASSLARQRLSTLLGDAQLTQMLKNVLLSGDASTAEAVEKILAQRSRRDADSVRRNAHVLQTVLQVGPATDTSAPAAERLTVVHSESAGRWSEWVERPAPGLQHVLSIATKFVLAQPEYLAVLAPLMFPKFPVNANWTRSALVTDLLKRTIRTLLDGCFLKGSACASAGEGVSSLVSTVIANGHEDLLHSNASLASAICRAALTSASAVSSLCTALLKLKSLTLSSFITAEMLFSICGPSRQQFCLAVMPNMHTLGADVKAAVLAEIDADDSDGGSNGDSSSSGQHAKRARHCFGGAV